jgi:hypothetical protein
MTAIWHSLVNVFVVIGALITAVACCVDRHAFRNSILLLVVGVACYGMDISAGIADGACAPSNEMSFLNLLGELDECGNPYGLFLVIAQIAIVGSVTTWLFLAWGAVLRKYDEERADSTDET